MAVIRMTEASFAGHQIAVQPCGNDTLILRIIARAVGAEIRVCADVHAHCAHCADYLCAGFAVRRSPREERIITSHRINARCCLIAKNDVIAFLHLCLDALAVGRIVDVRIQTLHQHRHHIDSKSV